MQNLKLSRGKTIGSMTPTSNLKRQLGLYIFKLRRAWTLQCARSEFAKGRQSKHQSETDLERNIVVDRAPYVDVSELPL